MAELRTAHTGDLRPAELADVRSLLEGAFDDLEDSDVEHCLGGVHALVVEDGALVAHGSVVMRRLLHDGRALRAGYVEGVAVRTDQRGRGHGAAVMAALGRVVAGAYDLGALAATDEALGFYVHLGWQVWRGPLAALTPTGVRPTPEEAGGVLVLPGAVPLDLDGPLTCDWRDGEVW